MDEGAGRRRPDRQGRVDEGRTAADPHRAVQLRGEGRLDRAGDRGAAHGADLRCRGQGEVTSSVVPIEAIGSRVVNVLTINLLFSTLVFWIAARVYVIPRLRELGPRRVMLPILLLHGLRHLGLMF